MEPRQQQHELPQRQCPAHPARPQGAPQQCVETFCSEKGIAPRRHYKLFGTQKLQERQPLRRVEQQLKNGTIKRYEFDI